jgi:hypothetical protein
LGVFPESAEESPQPEINARVDATMIEKVMLRAMSYPVRRSATLLSSLLLGACFARSLPRRKFVVVCDLIRVQN